MLITRDLTNAIAYETQRLQKLIKTEKNLEFLDYLKSTLGYLSNFLYELEKHLGKEVVIYDCETIVAKGNPLPPLDIEKAIAYKIYGQALENIPIGAMVMMNPENGHTFTYREKP